MIFNLNKGKNSWKNEYVFGTMWLLLGVLLLVQHQFVYMHFDDFGYASLSYGYDGNTNGMNWTFGNSCAILHGIMLTGAEEFCFMASKSWL